MLREVVEKNVVQRLFYRHDADICFDILKAHGIDSFVWEDNDLFKLVVYNMIDLERAKELV